MAGWLQRNGRRLVALFFVLLIAAGLFTVPDYGSAWDEEAEIGILRMALMEYAQLLPVDTTYHRALTELKIIPISQSIERDHGICAYYPLFWAVCRTDWSARQVSLLWRGYTWLLFCLGAFALYALARGLGLNRVLACATVFFLVLSPRLFAQAHYNNKDIALLSLTLLVLWQTMRLWQKPTLPRGLWFALAVGLCSGTRVIGIAVCGLCGLAVVARLAMEKELRGHVLVVGLITVLASALFYLLLTPAFLRDPLGFPIYLVKNAVGFSRWHGTVLFDGSRIFTASEKLPWQYLPVMILLTTPIWMLVLLFLGQGTALVRGLRQGKAWLQREDGFLLTLASLLWLLPLTAAIASRMLVYNGWRHFYFLAGPMSLLMAYGMNTLWMWAGCRKSRRSVLAVALTVCFGLQGVGIWRNHPYQYGYYNELVSRHNLDSRFELDYWNLSCTNALQSLMEQYPDRTLRVAPSDRSTRSGLIRAVAYLATDRITVVETAADADYVLANLMYARIAQATVPPESQWIFASRSYGVPMSVIYPAAAAQ